MRILLKILLFPITLTLSIVVAICRFVCHFSCALLSVAASIIFLIAVLALILLKDVSAAANAAILAFAISPYGIPKLVDWVICKIEDLSVAIRSI